MQTTRDVSARQERCIAKAVGGKRTPNSGATKFDKGDIVVGEWLLEAKTCMQPKKSFSIKKEWLTKLKEEQFATSKTYSSLCFDFGDNKDRYYILDENTFRYILDIINEK